MAATRSTAAVVGAAGGVGATRLALEFAATLARDDRSVALLDADFATQGLAARLDGRLEPDVTRVLTGDATVAEALVEVPLETPGRVRACPARAPFEALARAKTPEAAQRLEDAIAEAAEEHDHVLVDAPPVATNPAVAAVTTVDRVGAVTAPTQRGVDALQRLRGRLRDVGAAPEVAIANRAGEDHPVEAADVTIPEYEAGLRKAPVCDDPDPEFAPAVATAVETLFGTQLDLSFPDPGWLSR